MKIRTMALLSGIALSFPLSASVLKVASEDFTADANLITFSEVALGTVNPVYTAADYGGEATDPIVSFGGYFLGQSLSASPDTDCPGAAASACIVGSPLGPLSLDVNAPDTFTVNDGSNPTSPVLSGSPTFNGGVALLFSEDQFAVGFDGGFFDAVASTAITAFDRNGNVLGSVANEVTGIEFLGLAMADGANAIAGVFLDLIGEEPAGFAIDNIRFGSSEEVDVVIDDGNEIEVSEPAALSMFALLFAGLISRKRMKK